MLLLNLVVTMNQQTMKGFVGFHQQEGTKLSLTVVCLVS